MEGLGGFDGVYGGELYTDFIFGFAKIEIEIGGLWIGGLVLWLAKVRKDWS